MKKIASCIWKILAGIAGIAVALVIAIPVMAFSRARKKAIEEGAAEEAAYDVAERALKIAALIEGALLFCAVLMLAFSLS